MTDFDPFEFNADVEDDAARKKATDDYLASRVNDILNPLTVTLLNEDEANALGIDHISAGGFAVDMETALDAMPDDVAR